MVGGAVAPPRRHYRTALDGLPYAALWYEGGARPVRKPWCGLLPKSRSPDDNVAKGKTDKTTCARNL